MKNASIHLQHVSKYYKLYNSPKDRLKEALSPGKRKYHRQFYALNDINLDIGRGEIVGIVGRNGSGKSTLLKLIAGVLTPNSGSVAVNGQVSALLELGAGFNPVFTGLDNIYFYGTILGLTRKEMDRKLDDIVAFADIGDFINQPLRTYSSGMKARLGFAVAVHINPDILILDEVLSVGDALFRRKCYAKMEEFFNSGKTILYVSHSADSVNQLCSRAILLERGSIIMDGKAKEVTARYQQLLFAHNEPPTAARKRADDDRKVPQSASRPAGESGNVYHADNFISGLISKSRTEYRNRNVLILNARIVDHDGRIVNLLNFKEKYRLRVDVEFGIDARNVCFGLEVRDEKGVRVTTVDSIRMHENGIQYAVNDGDAFSLEYSFTCLFRTGLYYLSIGVSSFENGQSILNRIVDALVFKTIKDDGFSSGYFENIDRVKISNGQSEQLIEIL